MSPSLPKSYKAAVITKTGSPLEIKEIDLKLPEKGHVLIKTIACGVCHSDVAVQQGAFGDLAYVVTTLDKDEYGRTTGTNHHL